MPWHSMGEPSRVQVIAVLVASRKSSFSRRVWGRPEPPPVGPPMMVT